MWEQLLPSDWMQCVVESAPDSMSVSSGEHLKEQDNKSKKHVSAVRHHSAELSGSTRTSSCSEEGRCSELDSPPGMLNWDQQPWECRGQPGCYSGSSLIGCQSGSFGFQAGRKSVPKRKRGEKINVITFTKQHKRNNSIFEGSNKSGSS